jgi:thymidylate synthase (FAD)
MKGIQVVSIDYERKVNRVLMNLAAGISQKGHAIHTMKDLLNSGLLKEASDAKVKRLTELPHPTLQKMTTIPLLFINVSRRFLAQITRHQNEIKFTASSFRYGYHSEAADFVVPIEVSRADHSVYLQYEKALLDAFAEYKSLVKLLGSDAAAYAMPQATCCTILASATPYQWKHIIGQRTCRRCAPEMRYTMLLAWETLYKQDPVLFSPSTTGTACTRGTCQEGTMCCNRPIGSDTPGEILKKEFGDLLEGKR